MSRRRLLLRPRRALSTLLLALSLPPGLAGCGADRAAVDPAGSDAAAGEGIAVLRVEPGSHGERAGIEAGDLLTAWRLPSGPGALQEVRGRLASPFDLADAAEEQSPRGDLVVSTLRAGVRREAVLPPGDWGLSTAPLLPADQAAALAAAEEARAGERFAAACDAFEALAAQLGGDPGVDRGGDDGRAPAGAVAEPVVTAWLLDQAADAARRAKQPERARDLRRQAIAIAAAAGAAAVEARLQRNLAVERYVASDLAAARVAWQAAAGLWQTVPGAPLRRALALDGDGQTAVVAGQLATAEEILRSSLAIKQEEAPGSLAEAITLSILGRVLAVGGDLGAAEEVTRRALAIREQRDPEGAAVSSSLANLGAIVAQRGDYSSAAAVLARSLARLEASGAQTDAVASTLVNLGVIAERRGDLQAAEGYYRRALAFDEERGREALNLSTVLNNLGGVLRDQGDLDSAEEALKRSLALREKFVPGTLDVAFPLTNLAGVALERGDLDEAEHRLSAALAIQQAAGPQARVVGITLHKLGQLAVRRDQPAVAERYFRRAIDHLGGIARLDPAHGFARRSLADLLREAGRLTEAEALYREALEILQRSAPGSADEADALWGLARVARAGGRSEEALRWFVAAEEALETQQGRLGGGDETRVRFRQRYQELYREHVDLLVELGLVEEAFSVLERSRARSLLTLLAERELVFERDLPPELDRERRRTAVAVDRAQEALMAASSRAAGEEVETLVAALRRARRRQRDVAERVRASSPRLAAFSDPTPLDIVAARAALEPGVVVLAFSLGERSGHVFALGSDGGFAVAEVAAGRQELAERVERLRLLIGAGGGADRSALDREASGLYELLIAPVEAAAGLGPERLGPAPSETVERWILLPDGPLHLLPFSVLRSARGSLASRVPLSTAPSLSVWTELGRRRGPPPATSLAAFADPASPLTAAAAGGALDAAAQDGADAMVMRSLSRAGSLPPLPASRAEAAAVAARFRRAETFVGAAATEARARRSAGEHSHLHFAVHGYFDERFPLSSGLVLARDPEGPGNGILQAWEIFEGLRTEAELVTLSACETALGSEAGSEGLLGLTRAFQYAGARSVLASLWQVSDRSTAALMSRFYTHLGAGLSADQALAAARAELAAGPVSPPSPPRGLWGTLRERLGLGRPPATEDFTHPYHWAAFRVDGRP